MLRSLWTAASGMESQQMNIDVISNNLANVNTVGFKRSRADFQDLLYQTVKSAGTSSSANTQVPTGIQIGLGSKAVAVQKLFTQGGAQKTGSELDLAIEGEGFFQILQPNGELAYTRAGGFKLDSNGRIVTSDGYPLNPEMTIPIDTTSITIGLDGTVSVIAAGIQTTPTEIGKIQLADFSNPAGLSGIGRNLFIETFASGTPTTGVPGENGIGSISQGYLEMSNVSVIDEMVNMIVGQRAYEVNGKAISTADEMLQTANNLRR